MSGCVLLIQNQENKNSMTTGKLIKIKEAADILGVTGQTVKNWCKSGVLHSVNRGNVWYVNSEEVKALTQSITDVENSKRLLKEEKSKYMSETRQYNEFREQLRNEFQIDKLYHYSFKKLIATKYFQIITDILLMSKSLSEKQANILNSLLEGESIPSLAERYGITVKTMHHTICRAIREVSEVHKLKEKMIYLQDLEDKNRNLQHGVEVLKRELQQLNYSIIKEKGIDEQTVDEKFRKMCNLLSMRVREYGECLSVRTINCLLGHNMETVGDVVRHSKEEILKMRHIGRRVISELEDFVELLGLSFGMDVDSYYIAYSQLVNNNNKPEQQ